MTQSKRRQRWEGGALPKARAGCTDWETQVHYQNEGGHEVSAAVCSPSWLQVCTPLSCLVAAKRPCHAVQYSHGRWPQCQRLGHLQKQDTDWHSVTGHCGDERRELKRLHQTSSCCSVWTWWTTLEEIEADSQCR